VSRPAAAVAEVLATVERRTVSIRGMSVWTIAMGLEIGIESMGITGRRVRFFCFSCLAREDPKGEASVRRAPFATECMRCTTHDGEIFCALFFNVPTPDAEQRIADARRFVGIENDG
jgi:hypothetical protein